MSLLVVENLSKRFHGFGPAVVSNLNFKLEPGGIVALLGPSGCGKTTTLRLIAGFERPDGGEIRLEDRVLFAGTRTDLAPESRGIGFVFQDYALFPHLSVLENACFGLRLPRSAKLERAREVLAMVGLTVFQDRMPHQLSGGQQQRVALARALAPRPKLILLDEPFSSLDAALRASTRHEVRQILERIGATALLVTHDQEEAMAFADQLIVMRDGQIEQQGPPEQVYQQPKTAFVAGFLGLTNLVPAQASGLLAQTALGEVVLETPSHGPLMLSIRPEDLRLETQGALPGLRVKVVARAFKGHDVTLSLEAERGPQWTVQVDRHNTLRVGDLAWLRLEGRAVVVRGSDRSSLG